MKKRKQSYTVYFGGELFSLKHLLGNAYLAEAIYDRSHGRFLCQLPQDFEVRGRTARYIRDQDLRMLVGCDLALFNFDGPELDAGTLVEFLFAKFADLPAVILRSDFRLAGDGADPWNLMASHYPRTLQIRINSLASYQAMIKRRRRRVDEVVRLAGQHSSADAQRMCEEIAAAVVRSLDRALRLEPVMPRHLREEVYQWLPQLAAIRGKQKVLRREFEAILERKVQRDLL